MPIDGLSDILDLSVDFVRFVIIFIIMFNIYNQFGGQTCTTVSDANRIITSMIDMHPGVIVHCELLDDSNEPVSFWSFDNTHGDLVPAGADPT